MVKKVGRTTTRSGDGLGVELVEVHHRGRASSCAVLGLSLVVWLCVEVSAVRELLRTPVLSLLQGVNFAIVALVPLVASIWTGRILVSIGLVRWTTEVSATTVTCHVSYGWFGTSCRARYSLDKVSNLGFEPRQQSHQGRTRTEYVFVFDYEGKAVELEPTFDSADASAVLAVHPLRHHLAR